MADTSPVEMDADERDAFLDDGGTGVISFEAESGSPPHSIPISYGYDADREDFYFRLAAGGDSEKGDLDDRPVTFVVAEETGEGWRSVVARGRLESTTEADVATETLDGLQRVEIPYVDIFDRPTRLVDFEFFRLRPAELTGRAESPRGE